MVLVALGGRKPLEPLGDGLKTPRAWGKIQASRPANPVRKREVVDRNGRYDSLEPFLMRHTVFLRSRHRLLVGQREPALDPFYCAGYPHCGRGGWSTRPPRSKD